jgi:hypothetical protein
MILSCSGDHYETVGVTAVQVSPALEVRQMLTGAVAVFGRPITTPSARSKNTT